MERFRATIQRDGVNAYVDVPRRVSEKLRSHARAGRVRVEGLLESAIRGTLVPVASGRHRLLLNRGYVTA